MRTRWGTAWLFTALVDTSVIGVQSTKGTRRLLLLSKKVLHHCSMTCDNKHTPIKKNKTVISNLLCETKDDDLTQLKSRFLTGR